MPDQAPLAERIAALIAADQVGKPVTEPRRLAYNFKGAALALGLSVSTIQREVRVGRLRATRVRGRVLITEEEMRRYLAEMGA
jgi:excisionase family DNA binding protein